MGNTTSEALVQAERIEELPEWAQNYITELNNVIGQQQVHTGYLENQVWKKTGHMREQNEKINQLISENDDKRAGQVADLQRKLTSARNQINEQTKKIKILNAESASRNSQIEKLKADLSLAHSQIKGQSRKTNQLVSEKASFANEIKNLKKRLENDESSSAKTQISGQNRKINQLVNENANNMKEITLLKKQLVKVSKPESDETLRAKSQISGQNKKINQLITENASYANQIKNLKDQLATMTADEDTGSNQHVPKKTKRGTRGGRKKREKLKKKNEILFDENTITAGTESAVSMSSLQADNYNQDIFECTICGSGQSTLNRILFTPCGHGSCSKCGNQLTNCHICESNIIEKLKQFE